MVGGGARNDVWLQIIASSFGVPVTVIEEAETAALGAALQAGAIHSGEEIRSFVAQNGPATGKTVQPVKEEADPLAAAFARHEAHVQSL